MQPKNTHESLFTKEQNDLLTDEKIAALQGEAGFSGKDFETEWQPEAIAYRAVILELADIFCENMGNWENEVTHSEYMIDAHTGKVKSLDICMELLEERENGEAEIKGYQEFKKFLEDHTNLISQKLRQKFDMYIGFNYEGHGAIVIREKEINLISQEVYETLESNGSIGYTKDMKKERQFRNMIGRTIREIINRR